MFFFFCWRKRKENMEEGSALDFLNLPPQTGCGIDDDLTEALKQELDYGDLPKELWSTRFDQEQWWVAPKTVQNQFIVQTLRAGLPYPARALIAGTNGTYAFALVCMDDQEFKPPPPHREGDDESAYERCKKLYDSYATANTLFNYKYNFLSRFECRAFQAALKHRIRELSTRGEATKLLHEHVDLAKVDVFLSPAISAAGPLLSKALKVLPAGEKTQKTKRIDSHTAGKSYASVKGYTYKSDAHSAALNGEMEKYNIFITNNTTKKKSAWHFSNLTISCKKTAVPSLIFNKTHLCVFYQSGTHIVAELYRVVNCAKTIKEATHTFQFPDEFARGAGGMFNAVMSDEGVVCVTFATGAVCFDMTASSSSPENYAILLTDSEDHYRKTSITCAAFTKARPDCVLFGTTRGEVYGVNYKTGNLYFAEHVRAIEPILSVKMYGKLLFMHTVTEIAITEPGEETSFMDCRELGRPVAFDVCGGLVFVLSKYGTIHVFSVFVRNFMRTFERPAGETHAPHLQYAYQGVVAEADKVTVVYPSGNVRVLLLSHTRADEEKKKEKK
jgi:hypothetical protein